MTLILSIFLAAAVMCAFGYWYEGQQLTIDFAKVNQQLDDSIRCCARAATMAIEFASQVQKYKRRLGIAQAGLTDIWSQNAGQATFEVWAKARAKSTLDQIVVQEPTEVLNPPMPTHF